MGSIWDSLAKDDMNVIGSERHHRFKTCYILLSVNSSVCNDPNPYACQPSTITWSFLAPHSMAPAAISQHLVGDQVWLEVVGLADVVEWACGLHSACKTVLATVQCTYLSQGGTLLTETCPNYGQHPWRHALTELYC
eukprot:1154738-Pelagomonas_calceolata.AAC.1